LLKIEALDAYYGEAQALYDVSLHIDRGEVVSVLGANGAGKTTLINALSGTIDRVGTVSFDGHRVDRLQPHVIAARGLVQVPEGRRLFNFMSVRENLELGAYSRHARAHVPENIDKVFTLMPRLAERSGQMAGSLSGGEQQMCAIGRAMMAMPKMIMFDEPTLGLAPIMVDMVFKLLNDIKASGLTILLVEQNVKHALAVSDRAYVIENGRVVLGGKAAELINDPQLKVAYLGG